MNEYFNFCKLPFKDVHLDFWARLLQLRMTCLDNFFTVTSIQDTYPLACQQPRLSLLAIKANLAKVKTKVPNIKSAKNLLRVKDLQLEQGSPWSFPN